MHSELDSMFVETSSQEEWDKRGDYFYEHKLWLVAAKCYQRAGQGWCFIPIIPFSIRSHAPLPVPPPKKNTYYKVYGYSLVQILRPHLPCLYKFCYHSNVYSGDHRRQRPVCLCLLWSPECKGQFDDRTKEHHYSFC